LYGSPPMNSTAALPGSAYQPREVYNPWQPNTTGSTNASTAALAPKVVTPVIDLTGEPSPTTTAPLPTTATAARS